MPKFAIAFLLSICLISPVWATALPLEDVIEEVNPSVVGIAVDISDSEQALGAGIIIGADGYVVTNAHVMENAQKISVQTADGEFYGAQLIGKDDKTDIALIKVDNPLGFEPAHFADSDEIRVGNQVFAIGNPYGLGNSVSLGIISAKERDIEKGPYDNFLQTDASINQGNSGGPLFNLDGKIIGMSTAIFSEDGKNSGVGFATPSNIIVWVVNQLKNNGEVIRGWLGIGVQKVRTRGDDKNKVLSISSMVENSPASEAGLQVGDQILAFGEVGLSNPRMFSLEVAKLAPQTVVPVVISRNGVTLDFQVKVMSAPEEIDDNNQEDDVIKAPMLSLSEMGLDPYQVRNAVELNPLGFSAYYDENDKELVVTRVENESEAFDKGVKVGDRISQINNTPIYGLADFKAKVKQANGKYVHLNFSDDAIGYTVDLKTGETNGQN